MSENTEPTATVETPDGTTVNVFVNGGRVRSDAMSWWELALTFLIIGLAMTFVVAWLSGVDFGGVADDIGAKLSTAFHWLMNDFAVWVGRVAIGAGIIYLIYSILHGKDES